jgi:hypothetical protein
MKRSLLFVTVLAFSILAFGAGTVFGGSPPPPPPGWPGGHLFGLSPPNEFPPQGTTNRIPVIGQVGLDLDACPDTFLVDLAGYMDLSMPNALNNSGPNTTMTIEIVGLSLTGLSPITVNCGTGDDVVTVQPFAPAPPGQLIDTTNQTDGAFPAGVILNPHLQLTVPGEDDPVHAANPLQIGGQTAGWPPVDIQMMPNPLNFPMGLLDTENEVVGNLDSMIVLPTTPATTFMKSEAIRHEAETAGSVEQVSEELGVVEQGIEGDLEALTERMLQEQERAQAADSAEAKRLRKILKLLRQLK